MSGASPDPATLDKKKLFRYWLPMIGKRKKSGHVYLSLELNAVISLSYFWRHEIEP